MDVTKIIQILDPQAGTLRETVLRDDPPAPLALLERRGGHALSLLEASTLNEFPVLLRDGIKAITFDSYAGTRTTWQQWAGLEPSDKQAENWVEESEIGELPVVHENTEYPEFKLDLDRSFEIRNYKRGGIISVTEEMIKFNRTNLLRDQARKLGRSTARTREKACFAVLTNANLYVRNSTTGDNDVGANTAATTFSASGLITALGVLRTMKDRKSGAYLGVNPDTLVVTPRLEFGAKQLLLANALQSTTAAAVYGQGVANPLKGQVQTIIVSPEMGTSYQWALLEAKLAVILQEVEGMQILQERAGMIESEGYFRYDNVRYRVRDWYGAGMKNDRFAYYSSATAAPAIT